MALCRKIQNSDAAGLNGWVSRAKAILDCPSLVAALVAGTVVVGSVGALGWSKVVKIDGVAGATAQRQELIEQRLLSIERTLGRMDSKLDALMLRGAP